MLKHFYCLLDYGLGQLTSYYYILTMGLGFISQHVFNIHPPICRVTAHSKVLG